MRRSFGGGHGVFLLPGLAAFLAIIVLPFVMNVGLSLTRWRGSGTPVLIGLDNYARLLADATFWASFRNNLALIVAMTVIPTLVGLLLSAALFDFIGRSFGTRLASFFRAGYYLPQILPVAVAGIVWGWIYHPEFGALNAVLDTVGLGGLARNWLGDPSTALLSVMAVMIWFQLGYPVVIFMAGLARIDPELYEAAQLDGASWWARFRHISVPLIQPEIFVVVLTTTIHALKVFAPVFVLTRGGPGSATTVPAYFAWQNFFEKAQVGYGAAVSTVLTVIIVLLTVGFLRVQMRQGLIGGR